MRLVFMGTPDFALPSFDALLASSEHTVVGVVTQPDRPQGRGLQMTASPVKNVALAHDLPVLQPERFKDTGFRTALKALQADLFVVVAFRILPVSLLAMPRLGAINLHASLLPKYRGAAPIQWAIINGEAETGVTTFLLDRSVDTGHILLQRRTPVDSEETAGALSRRLAEIGAELLLETINRLAKGDLVGRPQIGTPSTAPKLCKQDGQVDWLQPAETIHNRIRGLNPYPMAYTGWRNRTVRLIGSQVLGEWKGASGHPGEIVAADKANGLVIQTGRGFLAMLALQPEGRKQMSAKDFVQGYRPTTGERFTIPAGLHAAGD